MWQKYWSAHNLLKKALGEILRGRSLPSSLRPMLVIFCRNKPFSSSGHLNRWAGLWASRALVRLFKMLEDSSACSWRGNSASLRIRLLGHRSAVPPSICNSIPTLSQILIHLFIRRLPEGKPGKVRLNLLRRVLSNSSIPSHGSYELLHLVERLPARREFYQSQLTCGANRGGLNACRRGAWNRHPAPGR